ncbi:MAG: hypothetical protein KJ064_25830 [Anaerolineae bacterium]|nr:hypothetical protein [Anaerolineae bacterium]
MKYGLLGYLSLLFFSFSHAQPPTPTEVFVEHDRTVQTASIYFTDAISGLSAPVVIQGFRPNLLVLEELTLTPNGVILKNPVDGRVQLAMPGGQIIPHPFIPQHSEGLQAVNWVLSPDRQSIAWVEVLIAGTNWLSNAYIADINGSSITPLPPEIGNTITPQRRLMPLALSNDRNFFFYDGAFPTFPPSLTDYFDDYSDIHVYIADQQVFQRLPDEPLCDCGAGVGGRGQYYVRLEQTSAGFKVNLWDLFASTRQEIASVGQRYQQAGDIFIPDGLPYAFYTQAENLDDESAEAQFVLMMVRFFDGAQEILIGPSSQRWRVQAVIDSGSALLLDNVYSGGTYKFDLSTRQLSQVSEKTWLGTVYP